jgi:hypothetical protein
MKPHLQTLVLLLKQNDLKGLVKHYKASIETDNLAQLAFIFQQSQKNTAASEFYQQMASKFIEVKGLPTPLIAQINNNDILSFFTPALKEIDKATDPENPKDNFTKVNQHQRNVLHYLFGSACPQPKQELPPFNYLRSMMLFESNESLQEALCQRDSQNLTPLETYLSTNQSFEALPAHEFTALLALIEIESKQHAVDKSNGKGVLKSVNALCQNQSVPVNIELQRLILIATYYSKSVEFIVNQMN